MLPIVFLYTHEVSILFVPYKKEFKMVITSPPMYSAQSPTKLFYIHFKKIFFYLFIHERQRQRGRERERERGRDPGRGRSRLPTRSLILDSIPGPGDHTPS